MRRILHVFPESPRGMAAEIVERQRKEAQVECLILQDEGANYGQLLEKVFAADSIHVWSEART